VATREADATAPVVPVPKNGSNTTSPGFVLACKTKYKSDSGFWVEWTFCPFSFIRSRPEQIGSTQSLRICRSSFKAFMV